MNGLAQKNRGRESESSLSKRIHALIRNEVDADDPELFKDGYKFAIGQAVALTKDHERRMIKLIGELKHSLKTVEKLQIWSADQNDRQALNACYSYLADLEEAQK